MSAEHWVDQARRVPSPNFNVRPDKTAITLIVVHSISLPPRCFGGSAIDDFFSNRLDCDQHPYFQKIEGLEVSSHFLIRRDGELVQYVPCDQRAWHAGASSWQGQENCNDYSIGVELEGDDHTPYETAQYERLADLIKLLMNTYPDIGENNITGHEDIAPGRKTDPGPAFDWRYLSQYL